MKNASENPKSRTAVLRTIFASLLAITCVAWVNPAHSARSSLRKRGEVRVVVTYKQEYSSTDRQALHLTLKTSFMKHYKSTHSDLTHVIWNRALSKKEAKERALAICKRYLESPLVKTCVPAL